MSSWHATILTAVETEPDMWNNVFIIECSNLQQVRLAVNMERKMSIHTYLIGMTCTYLSSVILMSNWESMTSGDKYGNLSASCQYGLKIQLWSEEKPQKSYMWCISSNCVVQTEPIMWENVGINAWSSWPLTGLREICQEWNMGEKHDCTSQESNVRTCSHAILTSIPEN